MKMTYKQRWLSLTVLVAAMAGCAAGDGRLERSRGPAADATVNGSEAALPKCPVMENEPIDLAISIRTKDGPVYFCCKACIAKYKANPDEYAEKVAIQRRALAEQR